MKLNRFGISAPSSPLLNLVKASPEVQRGRTDGQSRDLVASPGDHPKTRCEVLREGPGAAESK